MITLIIYLEDYDWLIKVFYKIDSYNASTALDELDSIGCDPDTLNAATELLKNGIKNVGLTYTDIDKHVTFIIIGLLDSAKEFMNTYIHEVGHAAMHIGEYYRLDPYSEDLLYLQGDIALEMFDVAKKFLCDHCYNMNFYNFGKVKIKFKKEAE